jgi:hypothetical protein
MGFGVSRAVYTFLPQILIPPSPGEGGELNPLVVHSACPWSTQSVLGAFNSFVVNSVPFVVHQSVSGEFGPFVVSLSSVEPPRFHRLVSQN